MIKGSVPIKTKERMYSTGVDYSTLSIYSLHRHDGNTVRLPSHPQAPPAGAHLLPSPPAGATSDMDKAAILLPSAPPDATPDRREQTTTEGHGEEDRHNRPSTPGHHGGNAGGADTITSGRHGERTIGTRAEAVHGLRLHQPLGAEGRHEGGTTTMSGQVRPGPGISEKPDVPAPAEGHLSKATGVSVQGPEDEGRASLLRLGPPNIHPPILHL
jgi:hypothetical protein